MSDERRDDGFDLFDFNAPDDPVDAADEPEPTEGADVEGFESFSLDPEPDEESGSRFGAFAAAMSEDEPLEDQEEEPEREGLSPASAEPSQSRFSQFRAAMEESTEPSEADETGWGTDSPTAADDDGADEDQAAGIGAAASSGYTSFRDYAAAQSGDETASAVEADSDAVEPAPPSEPSTYQDFVASSRVEPGGDADEGDDAVAAPAQSYRDFVAAAGGGSDPSAPQERADEADGDAATESAEPASYRDFVAASDPPTAAAAEPEAESESEPAAPSSYRDFVASAGAGDDPGAGEPQSYRDFAAASAEGTAESPPSDPPVAETPAAASYRDFVESMTSDEDDDTDWDRFTDEQYVQATTQEYSALAEEVARSANEPSQPSAVAADIPGLESGVVGLDDVAGEHAGAQLNVRTAADVGLRVLTGVGLLLIFGASLINPLAIGALATLVFFLAAGEFSAVLIRNDYRPIVPLTLAGTLGALVGAWVWGVVAIPVTLTITLIVAGLLFGVRPPEWASSVDAALTVLVVAWIGGLGAFVFPLIGADDYRWLIAGLVVAIVAMDVGQFFVGRRFGSRAFAPVVSPKKTLEGLVGGAVAAVAFSVGFAFLAPYEYTTAALLAAAAIVLGPLGDLSVSLVKRILGIKDMGTVLPGHGGLLDRLDALLFMIPAAWLIFTYTGLLT